MISSIVLSDVGSPEVPGCTIVAELHERQGAAVITLHVVKHSDTGLDDADRLPLIAMVRSSEGVEPVPVRVSLDLEDLGIAIRELAAAAIRDEQRRERDCVLAEAAERQIDELRRTVTASRAATRINELATDLAEAEAELRRLRSELGRDAASDTRSSNNDGHPGESETANGASHRVSIEAATAVVETACAPTDSHDRRGNGGDWDDRDNENDRHGGDGRNSRNDGHCGTGEAIPDPSEEPDAS